MIENRLVRLKQYAPDSFVVAIGIMVVLAWLFPGTGGGGSLPGLKVATHYGIALLFFFYGLRLDPDKLVNDLKNWKLHLVVQSITFVVFPALVLIFRPMFKGTDYEILWLAVFFLAALPSTVSSSVVMVSLAKGNIPAAIFNASASGMIGIVLTPLWMGLFIKGQTMPFDFGSTVTDLVSTILLPVVVGLLLHRFWGRWATRNSKYLALFDKSVILSVVYGSFADSFATGIFDNIGWISLCLLISAVIALFFVVYNLTRLLSRLMNFNREDQITMLFCGSKKSLMHGSVMAGVIFAGSTSGGIFLVPIMIYHAFQLFYISIVAHKLGKNV